MRGPRRLSSERPGSRSQAPSKEGHVARRAAGLTRLAVAVALVLGLLVACSDALQQATGRVMSVDSPAFGRVDGFVLATDDGQLTFDTSELAFQPEFPAVHLNEHRMLGSPVVVTYRRDGERLVVTKLDDA